MDSPRKPFLAMPLKVAGIFLACLMLWMLGMIILPSGDDPTPTIYHRADGTFSLNRKDGKSVTLEEIYQYFRAYKYFGSIRLVGGPNTCLGDWDPVLRKTAEAGAGHYHLEGANGIYRFTLPLAMLYEANPYYELINLSTMDDPILNPNWDTDTVIWVDESNRCDEVINTTLPLIRDGKSVLVDGAIYMHHDRNDNSIEVGKFTRRHGEFWEKHIQPWLDRLK